MLQFLLSLENLATMRTVPILRYILLGISYTALLSGCAHTGDYQTPPEIAATGTGKEPISLEMLPPTTVSSGALSTSATIGLLATQGVQIIQMADSLRIILPTDQLFESDSLDIKHSQYETLNEIAHLLKLYGNSAIYITGYTDDINGGKNAVSLTRAQARSILTYLWTRGVPASRLFSDGKGNTHPVSSNHSPMGSAENRRIEINTKLNCNVSCDA